MTPLRRIAWNGVAAVSALFCLATCALGVRSYWYFTSWDSHHYWNADGSGYRQSTYAFSRRGSLSYDRRLLVIDSPMAFRVPQAGNRFDARAERWKGPFPSPWTYGGFGFQREHFGYADNPKSTENGWRIAVPYWFVAALFALPPAAWWLAFRRARLAAWRLRHQRCFQCGYNLQATPKRCPECGTVPASA